MNHSGTALPAFPPRRQIVFFRMTLLVVFLVGVLVIGTLTFQMASLTDSSQIAQAPSWQHPFGTDTLGRDVALRSISGLSLSLKIGIVAASVSTLIAIFLALIASAGPRWADQIIALLIDAFLAVPHLLLLLLISFAFGGGALGVTIAVSLSHWPRLARILRAELLNLRESDFVAASRGFGMSRFEIARRHLLPHLRAQSIIAFLVMFPHAILHEAALTFLGFGLEPTRPAIGVMLAEAMRSLTAGYWWMGMFPGLALLAVVLAFNSLAEVIRAALDPRERHT